MTSLLHGRLASLAALMISIATSAAAADITLRPDLRGHLSELRTIYPWQGADTARGESRPQRPHYEGEPSGGLPILREHARAGLRVIKVSGRIEPGDTERLRTMLFDRGGMGWSAQALVVFDSPGGNLLEGIRMGVMLAGTIEGGGDTPLEGVAVLSGRRCLSACALAFALATEVWRDDRRFIEDGAVLGFHMGTLPEEALQQTAPVQRVMDLSYEVVLAYNRLTDTGANPPLLLTQALEHRRSDSFFNLRGDLRGWFFGFTPVSRGVLSRAVSASGLTLDTLSRICRQSALASRMQTGFLEVEFGHLEKGSAETLAEAVEGARSASMVMTSQGSDLACRVTLRQDGTVAMLPFRLTHDCVTRVIGPEGPPPIPQRCLFPEDVDPAMDPSVTVGMLADAVGCSNGRLTERGFYTFMPVLLEDEGFSRLVPIGTVREVLRPVNLRAEPALDALRLTTLQPDDAVTVMGCRLTGDGQAVWLNLRHGQTEGWASARFLKPTLDDRIEDLIPWED